MQSVRLDFLFGLGSLAVFPFWLLLIFAPRWSWTARVAASPLIIIALTALYLLLALPNARMILPALIRPVGPHSWSAARLAFRRDTRLAALPRLRLVRRALDLPRQPAEGLSAAMVSPILALTLMLGPGGFLAYLAARRLSGMRSAVAPVP